MPDDDLALRVRMRLELISELQHLVAQAGDTNGHLILLSDYEVANLREAIRATGQGSVYRSPLSVLNTGDWLGMLAGKLMGLAPDAQPNVDAGEMARRALVWNSQHSEEF